MRIDNRGNPRDRRARPKLSPSSLSAFRAPLEAGKLSNRSATCIDPLRSQLIDRDELRLLLVVGCDLRGAGCYELDSGPQTPFCPNVHIPCILFSLIRYIAA